MLSSLIHRYLHPRIEETLLDTPVVMVNGPRQAGKTTLVRQFSGPERPYFTLDDPATLAVAKQDPVGFVRTLNNAIIDEVQRAPELLLAIKLMVDQDRRPGRFLITGSANIITLPHIADSLAGRIEILPLLPLAGCELQGSPGQWLDAVFSGEMPKTPIEQAPLEVGAVLVQRVLSGGYPQALTRTTPRRREAWAAQYLEMLIQRDVRDIAAVEKLDRLPRLLTAVAHISGQLCNFSQLAGQIGLDHKTAEKYLAVFEQMFLLRRVSQWSGNELSRIVKSPKLQFLDSGLLCSLLGLNEDLILRQRQHLGAVLESYVYGELLKMSAWAQAEYRIATFRTTTQTEVDFVLENRRGDLVGIEVKAAASFHAGDFAGLKKLAALADDKFLAGVLLYDGVQTLPMGDVNGEPLWAVPLSTLWLT